MPIVGSIVWLILIGSITFYCAKFFVGNIRSDFWLLFTDFRQKMWMTVGLGLIFFGLYAALIWLGSYLMDSNAKQQLFELMIANPQHFIYLGLLVFVAVSIAIYFVRMFIKYLYKNISTK